MKKVMIVVAALVFLMTGCKPEKEEAWSRFYGFTKEDVLGHYEANPDESCYEDYPVVDVATHRNAQLDIIDQAENTVSVHIIIPDVLNITFTGIVVGTEESDCVITAFGWWNEELILDVYKNAQNQIRLHGSIKRTVSGIDNKVEIFDVVKK